MLGKYSILFSFFILFSGCTYNVNNLRVLPSINVIDNSNKTNEIVIAARMLNSLDCINHFGIDLIDLGYIPIQVKIINLTSNNYALSPRYINLPLVSAATISKLMHYPTSKFAWLAGIPAFLFFWPATILVGAESFNMYRNNKNMDYFIKNTSIEGQSQVLTIDSYGNLEKFLFIEKNAYAPAFEIKLYNKADKNFVSFCIDIEK